MSSLGPPVAAGHKYPAALMMKEFNTRLRIQRRHRYWGAGRAGEVSQEQHGISAEGRALCRRRRGNGLFTSPLHAARCWVHLVNGH